MMKRKKKLLILLIPLLLVLTGTVFIKNIKKVHAAAPQFTSSTKFEFIDEQTVNAGNGVVFKFAEKDPYKGTFNKLALYDDDSIFGAYKTAYVSTKEYSYISPSARYVLSHTEKNWFYVYKIEYFEGGAGLPEAGCEIIGQGCSIYKWVDMLKLSDKQVNDLKSSYKDVVGKELKEKELLNKSSYLLAGEVKPIGKWETPAKEVLEQNTIWLQDNEGTYVETKIPIKKCGDKYCYSLKFSDVDVGGGLYLDSIYQLKFLNSDGANISFKTYTWSATTSFKIFKDENGVYKIKNLNTSPEAGKDIIKLDDVTEENGINLTVRETVTSPLNSAITSAMNMIIGFINSTVTKLSGWVESALENTDIEDTKEAWFEVRTIAITLLLLGLIIVAFANVLNIDIAQYGAQRMIPRFVMNIVLTFFSFLIVKLLLEVANILQIEFRTIMVKIGASTQPLKDFSMQPTLSTGDVVGNIGSLLLLVIILIGLIVAMLYLFLMLIARIVVIKFLVVMGPVALILGIMPFTESQLKQWWSELFKWIFMGPAIMGLLLIGSIILKNLGGAGGASSVNIREINTSFLDNFQNVFYILTAAAAYFMAAAIPLQMGGKIMAAWDKRVRSGAKHIPGYRAGSEMLGQRKKLRDAAISRKAQMRLSKLADKGRLGRIMSGANKEQALALKEQMISGYEKEASVMKDPNERGDALDQAIKSNNMYKQIAIMRQVAQSGTTDRVAARMLGMSVDDDDENVIKAIADKKQELIDKYSAEDSTVFKNAMTGEPDLAISSGNKALAGASAASITGSTELKQLKGKVISALYKDNKKAWAKYYNVGHFKRTLDQGTGDGRDTLIKLANEKNEKGIYINTDIREMMEKAGYDEKGNELPKVAASTTEPPPVLYGPDGKPIKRD